jgi:hypothetical protein
MLDTSWTHTGLIDLTIRSNPDAKVLMAGKQKINKKVLEINSSWSEVNSKF